jgi:hypothetical protein
VDDIVKGRSFDAESRRALGLDTLSAILPMNRRDRLAQLLTDDDVATLKHLAREGMGENSLRALTSDLVYLEGWAAAASSAPLPWPATEALALKFVAHHLWHPAQRESDPRHGMPAEVAEALRAEGLLRSEGPARAEYREAAFGELGRAAPLERGSMDRSARRLCGRLCVSPCGPRRGRAGARASAP